MTYAEKRFIDRKYELIHEGYDNVSDCEDVFLQAMYFNNILGEVDDYLQYKEVKYVYNTHKYSRLIDNQTGHTELFILRNGAK